MSWTLGFRQVKTPQRLYSCLTLAAAVLLDSTDGSFTQVVHGQPVSKKQLMGELKKAVQRLEKVDGVYKKLNGRAEL